MANPDLRELHVAAARDLTSDATSVLVERYSGLARSIALRHARSAQEADDVVQVAMFGLLQAIKRFDPDRGFEFSTFAHATIEGELKRYRRRTAWGLRVPRRLQEGYLRVSAVAEELAQELRRQPTVEELAERAGVPIDEAVELLELRDVQRLASIDAPLREGETRGGARDIAISEPGFTTIDTNEFVRDLLERLGPREREIVSLRFFENLTQTEIAARIGLSQMQVSRVLRTALEKLRILASA